MARNFLGGSGEEFNLPQLEEAVLKFWDEEKIFEKSVASEKSVDAKEFVFYEGPPYANGKPGIHHVLARVVKDVVLRYKTMQGYHVPRRAGWDTHGLPVEMAAEKALGLKSKKEIEKFGVKKFNEIAKEQVWIHKDEWERLTRRIGYWLDLKNAYVTYDPEYIETIWWSLAEMWRRKLLYKGFKVVPWCTRCGTSLSSHELAQGYKETEDNSVYIKFKLKPGQTIGQHLIKPDDKIYVLSWTTTPWTLPGNVALAVGPTITYCTVERDGEYLIAAVDRLKEVGLEDGKVSHTLTGEQLVGLEYEPLFDVKPLQKPASYKIYPADFVTTTDGTGVVHTAVMYGEDDYALGKKVGLPAHHTVDEEGNFTNDVPDALAGRYVKSKETEEKIFEHLRDGGNLLRIKPYVHDYPYCWRCDTAILYYARTSWFIAMSTLREKLLQQNETINWMPAHIREGRFGEWLREVKDWNLSRERYWGAPLPIWECKKCGHTEVAGSLDALDALAGGSRNTYWAMRHGEAENNIFKIADSGSQNFRLTPEGEKQIKDSLKAFKKELDKQHKKIDLILSSNVPRAQETARAAAEALGAKVVIDDRLREVLWGSEYDGKPIAEYLEKMPTYEDRFAKRPEGGESFRDVRRRAWGAIEECEAKYDGKNILFVSHGETIWMMFHAGAGTSERATIARKRDDEDFYPPTGSIREVPVRVLPRNDTGEVDLHRPFADDITLPCPECKMEMRRVKEVADVWYDSGAMPYAQNHFPFGANDGTHAKSGNVPASRPPHYPADYIAEGIDQTRGWFYTLLAIATALGYEAPYKNVITFGLINDKFGKKMSKSKGNIVEPFAVIDQYGVDAVRWYFYTGTPFGEPKNFDEREIAKALRRVHLIVYNSFVFWKTYAGGIEKAAAEKIIRDPKNILDAWILARLNETIASISDKLDKYEIREAALEIETLVDDLSRWYIRRSRRRLQRPQNDADYKAASATLGHVLFSLIKMMAPFTPFFSEVLYAPLGGVQESVHLDEWPAAEPSAGSTKDNQELIAGMKAVREFAAAGLAKRAGAGIKVRQPLASMTIASHLSEELQNILTEEVNVKKIIVMKGAAGTESSVALDTVITPELREEGLYRDLARMVQELRQKAGLMPKDAITVMMETSVDARVAIQKQEAAFKNDVGAIGVEYKKSEKIDAEEAAKLDGMDMWIGIRKV